MQAYAFRNKNKLMFQQLVGGAGVLGRNGDRGRGCGCLVGCVLRQGHICKHTFSLFFSTFGMDKLGKICRHH